MPGSIVDYILVVPSYVFKDVWELLMHCACGETHCILSDRGDNTGVVIFPIPRAHCTQPFWGRHTLLPPFDG